jgi:cytochrome c peroxidase
MRRAALHRDRGPRLEGAFKTPGLRGVALRAPYMHAGQVISLEDVVRHYVQAPHAVVGESELAHVHDAARPAAPGHPQRKPIQLSQAEQHELVAFLHTLSDVSPAQAARRDPP